MNVSDSLSEGILSILVLEECSKDPSGIWIRDGSKLVTNMKLLDETNRYRQIIQPKCKQSVSASIN